MRKQIIIKSNRRTRIGSLRIEANLSGISGWADSVKAYLLDGGLQDVLDATLERIQLVMLERFQRTEGESRYTKYTQTGATEKALLTGSTTSNGKGRYSLSAFDSDSIEEYMSIQDKGFKPFVHKQTYIKRDGTSKEVDVPKFPTRPGIKGAPASSPGPLVRGHSSGLEPGGRKFLLSAFEYWESIGRKQFEKDRIEMFRRVRRR